MSADVSSGGGVVKYRQPSLTYEASEAAYSPKIEGLRAVEQSIRHILSTERYSNPIYDDDYGVELEQFLGKDIGYIEACIGDALREALLQDDRITGVSVDSVSKSASDRSACEVEFTVSTIYGDTGGRLDVLQ